MAHARPKNSRDWVKRHLNDPYVKRSQEEGYRSRAVYKLSEIDANERLIKPGMIVIAVAVFGKVYIIIMAVIIMTNRQPRPEFMRFGDLIG